MNELVSPEAAAAVDAGSESVADVVALHRAIVGVASVSGGVVRKGRVVASR